PLPPPTSPLLPYTTLFRSCFGGPIHAYVVRGAVTRNDDNYEGREVPLRAGDLVGDEAAVDVPRNGRALLGATECNNFHVELGPRSEEHTSELQSRGHLVCR